MIEKNTRKVFQDWLGSPEGGSFRGRSPSSYGTYVQQCTVVEANIFEPSTLNVLEIEKLESLHNKVDYRRMTLTDAQIGENARLNDVKAGLRSFSNFLVWLMEYYSVARTFDQVEALIEASGPIGASDAPEVKGRGQRQRRSAASTTVAEVVDSYQLLVEYFSNRPFVPANLYQFGLEKSIFADRICREDVDRQFQLLINLLETGTFGGVDPQGRTRQNLHIRKYAGDKTKSQVYVRLYEKVFPRVKIVVEDSGNTAPKENLKRITKCQPFSQGEDAVNMQLFLKNFQCSHVFDNRTKNPLLFEGAWNVAFTPKVIDPFTGHETLGRWPCEFQPRFRNLIRRRFGSLIKRYNAFADKYRARIRSAAEEVAAERGLTEAEKRTFIADALEQWEPVDCSLENEPVVQ